MPMNVNSVVQLLSLIVPVAAAATLVAGYTYMEERERRQESALLRALEDMSKVLAEKTSRWEEWHLSQEKRIRDILQIEKRLEDVEAEQQRARRERSAWRRVEERSASSSAASSYLATDANDGDNGAPEEKEPYVCKLVLDPNTAHQNLALTNNCRKATRVADFQYYPSHPDRFDYWEQVLCTEPLAGRCYWEADWSGRVSIAMAYRGIHRRGVGGECGFGHNDRSWSLECYKWKNHKRYSVRHNKRTTELPDDPSGATRVGVYLDHAAGSLSFYSIASDAFMHLYTFQAEFSEPLYPGFMFGPASSVSLYQIESEKS